MPFVKNESEEKRDSAYLKYEAENNLVLMSNLFKIEFHFLPGIKKSVSCKGKDCSYCASGTRKNAEYNYYVNLNGNEGALNIKPSVFFSIQGLSKAMKKETREIKWIVLKEGQGLDTEYTVSKDENLDKEAYKKIVDSIEEVNKKLQQLMVNREKQLEENYQEYSEGHASTESTEPNNDSDEIDLDEVTKAIK